MLKKSE